jgi:hypothetical protein
VNAHGPSDETGTEQTSPEAPLGKFAIPGVKNVPYTDERDPGDWKSIYPDDARAGINLEATVLLFLLVIFCIASVVFWGFTNQPFQFPIGWLADLQKIPGSITADVQPTVLTVDPRLLAIFSVGGLGGTTFSIKWLVHAVAHKRWHLDRRYWRLFVPLIGGVYACVVLALYDGGLIATQTADKSRPIASAAALAFLVGYFSDGVSGLLSNIANAVFGTLEKR